MAENSKANEIRLIREYDAPVSAVWRAWSEPERIAQWYGPRGFTLTTRRHDLRTGGSWTHTMHGPDGVDYHNKTAYRVVEPGKKLEYDHGSDDDRGALFRATVLFSESGGKTTMDMTIALPTAQAAEEIRQFIKKVGGDATWDRLGEYLEKDASGKDIFIINRSFVAPLEKMFLMWTDANRLCRWVPPTGFEMQYIRADIREGGSSFYLMTGHGGMKMYGRADYQTIQKPDRLVYTQQFCDEHEKVIRHPMSATWPLSMLTDVRLAAEEPKHTRVTVTWESHGKVTAEELQTFIKARPGMTQGWTGSFDKLEAYLPTA